MAKKQGTSLMNVPMYKVCLQNSIPSVNWPNDDFQFVYSSRNRLVNTYLYRWEIKQKISSFITFVRQSARMPEIMTFYLLILKQIVVEFCRNLLNISTTWYAVNRVKPHISKSHFQFAHKNKWHGFHTTNSLKQQKHSGAKLNVSKENRDISW